MINRGVLLGQRETDYIAGQATFISYEARNPSGDWRAFLPPGEWQVDGGVDSMSCVSYSALNAIEAQEKFLTGEQPEYSDRWTAKMSGTMPIGNYLYKVGDSIRKDGLVLESEYPDPPSGYTFAEYHKDIPEPLLTELKTKGQAWLKKWDFKYEFVPADKESMLKHIKQAPLQIVIPGHAVMNFLCEQDIVNYFDSYQPFEKTTPYSNIQAALKPLLTKKIMTKKFIINDGGKIGILVLEGFTGMVAFAKDLSSLQKLKESFEVPDDAKTINLPQ